MQLIVDPKLDLLRSLIPGEIVSLREARQRVELSESQLVEAVAALTAALPELTTPPGALQLNTIPALIDPQHICASLPDSVLARLSRVAIYAVCESTNTEVISIGSPEPGAINVALSEYQTGGRGRHGRVWTSGFGKGVCLTVAVRLAAGVYMQPTLTMAIGVQLAQVLETHLTEPVLLKWPNDLMLGEGKLGGILVEMSSLPGGDQLLRIGVGINCELPDTARMSGGIPAVPPAALAGSVKFTLDRSRLVAEIVTGIIEALDTHEADGFDAFRSNWRERDYLRHQHVQVFDDERVRYGTALGIDNQGALRVSTDEGELALMSGEVRVRRR